MSLPISIASSFGPHPPSTSTAAASSSSSTSSSAAGSPSSSPPSSAYGLAGSWERWFGAPVGVVGSGAAVSSPVAGPSSASFGASRSAAETGGGRPFSFDFMTAGSRSNEPRLEGSSSSSAARQLSSLSGSSAGHHLQPQLHQQQHVEPKPTPAVGVDRRRPTWGFLPSSGRSGSFDPSRDPRLLGITH